MSMKSNVLDLSPEILTEIFLNLELENRKNVRLSCKSFYDACNRIPIICQEKFVLRSGYCIQKITKTLLSCQYLRMNLEFQGLPVDTFPVKIWKQCGEKIYSLIFYQSVLNDNVVKNVVNYCRNLITWKVWVHSCFDFFTQKSGFHSPKPFEELVKQNIVRNNLETFEVHINNDNIWASIIKKIFLIFPNIKTFGVLCWCSDGTLSYLDSRSCPSFAFTRIDKCIKSTNIERLRFDIPSNGHWLKSSLIWNLRLKEFQTSLFYTEKILDMLIEFFAHQTRLEVVCLTVNDLSQKLVKKLLFHIIKVCPNLSNFRLNYPTTYIIELNEYEFHIILKKRLEFLKLRFNVNNSHSDALMPSINLPISRNLHTLIIDSHDSAENDYVFILEYFQNLKHLDLCFITDNVLQSIFKHHINLEILKLNHVDHCTDFGFTGRKNGDEPSQTTFSIRRLKNLQCFDINSWNSDGFTVASLTEFIFPKLRHFRFAVGVDETRGLAGNFIKIAENAPKLEIVILDVLSLGFNQLLEFCSKLKRLYYIDCTETDINYADCVKLLLECDSLRFVAYEDEIFCYNPFTEKISQKPLNYFNIHSKCSFEFPCYL